MDQEFIDQIPNKAREAADAIIDNLKGRAGFDNVFDSLDEALKEEIWLEMAMTIVNYAELE